MQVDLQTNQTDIWWYMNMIEIDWICMNGRYIDIGQNITTVSVSTYVYLYVFMIRHNMYGYMIYYMLCICIYIYRVYKRIYICSI